MAHKPTAAQSIAINRRGGKMVVSAGAGSGKTTVLVQRAVNMILGGGVEADSLLIITFTNSAADELKSRLFAELDRAGRQDEKFSRQALLLRRAHIGTFDSYCKKLCTEHFAELELSPDFTLATGALADSMHARAISETMEEMYKSSEFRALSDMFGQSRSDTTLERLISHDLYRHLCGLGNPEGFKRLCIERFESGETLDQSVFGRYLMARAKSQTDYLLGLARKGCALCHTDSRFEGKPLEVLEEKLVWLEGLVDTLKKGYDEAAVYCQSRDFSRISFKKVPELQDEAEAIKAINTYIAGKIKELSEKYFHSSSARYERECKMLLPVVRALFEAEDMYCQKLAQLKKKRKAYEFDDIKRMALSLLLENGEPTELAKRLSREYTEVMVDEYQDTDDLQSTVYNALSDGGKKLFIVGDVKQSIYRFRQAEPGIMLRECENAFSPELDQFPMNVKLLENFRSEPSAINAVNTVFDTAMSLRLGDIDYLSQRLVAGRTDGDKEGVGLQLAMITDCEGDGDEQQARYCARKIKEIMRERPQTGYGDFAVLSQKVFKFMDTYEKVFKEEGVPLFVDLGTSVYETEEGRLLLDILTAIDNPLRDIPFATLLTAPAIGFGADRLLELRLQKRKGSLYPILREDKSPHCVRANEIISELLFLKTRLPIEELAAEVIKKLELDTWALSRNGGEYRMGMLRAFIDSAREMRESIGADLATFVRLANRKNGESSAQRRTPPEGMVQFKTIHTSKGLEWKYVFLVETEERFKTEADPLFFDSQMGMGARVTERRQDTSLRLRTAAHTAIALRKNAQTRSELVRLLYVALTRARVTTFVTAAVDTRPTALSRLYNFSRGDFEAVELAADCPCFYEWILLSLIRSYPAELRHFDYTPGTKVLGNIKTEVLLSVEPENRAEVTETEEYTEQEIDQLRERLDYSSPYAALGTIPAKRSVSALSKGGVSLDVGEPDFSRYSGLSGAQRGTALHMFMQCADYERARNNPKEELDRLIRGNYLEDSYAEGFDFEKLKTFFASELFEKMSSCERLYREYEFFMGVPSDRLYSDGSPDRNVIIQGIADCIAVTGKKAIIIDYKTDRNVTEEALVERYREQLLWYRRAIERVLEVEVEDCFIYSFYLDRAVRVG